MNDVDRWIKLGGQPPPGIREMLVAARRRAEPPPELEAELDRRVFTAIAAQRAQWQRARRRKLGLMTGLLVAAALGVLVLVLRSGTLGASFVPEAAPNAIMKGPLVPPAPLPAPDAERPEKPRPPL